MSRFEIERIRQRSKAKEFGPWVTDWDMMARKTVLRRLIRYAPMSPEAAQAVTVEERIEAGEELADIIPLANVDEPQEKPANKSEALAQRIKEARQDAAASTETAASGPVEQLPLGEGQG